MAATWDVEAGGRGRRGYGESTVALPASSFRDIHTRGGGETLSRDFVAPKLAIENGIPARAPRHGCPTGCVRAIASWANARDVALPSHGQCWGAYFAAVGALCQPTTSTRLLEVSSTATSLKRVNCYFTKYSYYLTTHAQNHPDATIA